MVLGRCKLVWRSLLSAKDGVQMSPLLPARKLCSLRRQQRFSSAPHASKESVELNLPADVLPSRGFVAGLKRLYEKDKLARILSELEVLYEISTEVPRRMTDDDWHLYFHLEDINERERFLARLYHDQLNAVRVAQQRAESDEARRQVSEEQQMRHDRGEMVYASGFHTYFDIRGQFFRRLADNVFGSRLMAAQRCDEMPPQLIVDCRFLHQYSDNYQSRFLSQIQRMYDANWFSRYPFSISIANLLADDRLARYIKRYWLFLCGPRKGSNECEDDELTQLYEELDASPGSHAHPPTVGSTNGTDGVFTPHPFIPSVSSRSVRDSLTEQVNAEEIVYISGSAPRLLDGPIDKYKAVVICASYDHQPWSSALCAARSDGLTPYRIPIDRYVKWERGYKVMPVDVTANIIRSVYANDGDWKSAILQNVPEYHFNKDHPITKRREKVACKMERQNRLKALEEAIFEMDRRRIDAMGAEGFGERDGTKEQSHSTNRTRRHRYSREDRRAIRNSQHHPQSSSD